MRDHDRQFDDEALSLLKQVSSTPDLSGRIMGRLGYMRAVDSVARRRRIHRIAARVGVFMLLIVMAVVAFQARDRTDQVRQPADVTVPAVLDRVGRDVDRHREGLGSLLRHIQAVPETSAPGLPEQTDGQENVESDRSPLDEEVNQSGLLPYKWA